MKTSYDLLRRLPPHFISNPVLHQVAKSFETSHIRFSGLFLRDGPHRYLLRKDDEVHISLDWQAYSILRASSRIILCSGGILKTEKTVFQSRESYGNPRIDELYRALMGTEPQKLMAFTRSFSHAQVQEMVNPSAYDLLPLPPFNSLSAVISSLRQQYAPVLVEFGVQLVDRYFEEVRAGGRNEIDTLLISTYNGNFHPRYKAGVMQFPLENYYDLEWRSERYPCELGKDRGEVEFEIYRLKK